MTDNVWDELPSDRNMAVYQILVGPDDGLDYNLLTGALYDEYTNARASAGVGIHDMPVFSSEAEPARAELTALREQFIAMAWGLA